SLQPDPDLPVLEVLLLPDGNGALESIDGVLAGVEGVLAMRRGDGDQDARLTDLQTADAVQDGDALDLGPPGADRIADLAHLRLGHRAVRLVLQELHRSAAGLVAHHAREDHDPTRPRVIDLARDGIGRQRRVDHAIDVVATATADRWKEAELVGWPETVPRLDILVADGEQRERPVRTQLRVAIDDGRPGRLDRTA